MPSFNCCMFQSVGSPPPGGRAHGNGCGRQPLLGEAACRRLAGATDRAQFGWGRGGIAGSYDRRGICCLRPGEIHPVRGGGRAGRGNGGTVRHCSCLGTLGAKGAIIGGAFVVCALEKSTPLGVGGGLAGAMAAPSAIAPALGH